MKFIQELVYDGYRKLVWDGGFVEGVVVHRKAPSFWTKNTTWFLTINIHAQLWTKI